MSAHYRQLDPALAKRIEEEGLCLVGSPFRCDDSAAIRRRDEGGENAPWRTAYVRDCEKILHLPYYSRYSDKTQVFSFYSNDDISRRALHVQLVSRIARNIGRVLGLNTDLIEAAALGHDLGHTPFGHAGERFLDELYHQRTGKHFDHNVQSARVLDSIFCRNLTLQTLDAVLCHNGEFEMGEYHPSDVYSFEGFDERMKACVSDGAREIKKLVPCTLEGCVVRVCDIIAYLGKDRQDAETAHIVSDRNVFKENALGSINAEIINNITVDIIENSYGKPYIKLSEDAFSALKAVKRENYELIYRSPAVCEHYEKLVAPMFGDMYERLLDFAEKRDEDSVLYRHHILTVNRQRGFYHCDEDYSLEPPDRIVTDFIAGMTDDYFIELYKHLFPEKNCGIKFVSYF